MLIDKPYRKVDPLTDLMKRNTKDVHPSFLSCSLIIYIEGNQRQENTDDIKIASPNTTFVVLFEADLVVITLNAFLIVALRRLLVVRLVWSVKTIRVNHFVFVSQQ